MFQTLQPSEALAFIQSQGENCLVLDVRTQEEFATGHLPMAINLPVDQIPTRIAELPIEKTLVIYCEHGSRSKLAANFLSAHHYPSVYHIQDGFSALAALI